MRKPKKKLKLKTKRAAVKRFKVTGTGKILRHQSGKRHILTKKTRSRKRRLRREIEQTGKLGQAVKTLLA